MSHCSVHTKSYFILETAIRSGRFILLKILVRGFGISLRGRRGGDFDEFKWEGCMTSMR